jgi:hypothetical protein
VICGYYKPSLGAMLSTCTDACIGIELRFSGMLPTMPASAAPVISVSRNLRSRLARIARYLLAVIGE